ncbi:MAG: hypothetical protein IPP88_03255 [Betaproteobacteria bacterium]|nr:hypothetical protein [Betaproteobacteria bacterium]
MPPSRNAANLDTSPTQKKQTLSQLASHEVERCHRRLFRINTALADLPIDARHRVGIDAKRLHYAADFSRRFIRKSMSRAT